MGQRESCEHCVVKTKFCQGRQVSKVWQRYSATQMVEGSERGWEHGTEDPKVSRLPNHLQAAMCMLTSGLQITSGISCATNLGPVLIWFTPVKLEPLQPW